MSAKITLTVSGGRLDGKEFTFADCKTYVIGRGTDCDLRIPCTEEFQTVSRHHCLLCVDAPNARVRDLGSRNGTIVNGEQIGRPEFRSLPDDRAVRPFAEHELKDGDVIKVGNTFLKVHISEPPRVVPEPEIQVKQGKELCGCE